MKRLIWIMCFIPVFANANQWQRFYEKDPITDAEKEWAYIENYSSTPANEKVGVTLRVGCASQGAYVSFEFTAKTVEMLYRIDSEEPVQLEKFINFDDFHSSLITGENAIPLIKTLMNGKSLIVRRKGSLTALSQSDHIFEIKNKSSLLEKVTKKCL